MISLNKMLRTALVAVFLNLVGSASATPTSGPLTLKAKEALDAHYGNQKQLNAAAALLTRALAEDEPKAMVYVQAARLTIKGGHVVATRFRPGTVDAYGELLDRALSLDPVNAKARILKAEYFHLRRDYRSERAELDKANETGTKDAWLLVGYGRHHEQVGKANQAFAYYTRVRDRGPGPTTEQRNAYISSLNRLAAFAVSWDDPKALRELMQLIRKECDPRDAWALGNLSDSLVSAGMFDDAIATAREALATMSYGSGRLTLTAALYGKAAELTVAGEHEAAAPLLQEAHANGFSRRAVLDRFAYGRARIVQLRPTLEALVK